MLCWAALVLAHGAAATEAQDWTYNSTLWWAGLFGMHPLRGPSLVTLAEQLTQLIYDIFNSAIVTFGVLGSITEGEVACDVKKLDHLVHAVHQIYAQNVNIMLGRLELQSGPLHDAAGTGAEDVVWMGAKGLLESTVDLGRVAGCEAAVAMLDSPGEGACQHLVQQMLYCTLGLSNLARAHMAQLHAAQIRELGMISAVVLDERIPWPPPAVFDVTLGLSRAEILRALLEDLRSTAAPIGSSASSGVRLRAVEIGVDDGRTSEALLSKLPDLHMLLVDPYEFAGEGFFEYEEGTFSATKATTIMNSVWDRMAPFRSRSVMVCQRSVDAAEWVAPGSLDLVFIDGDHRYEAVRQDMEVWRRKLRPGGVLAGHDYSLFGPGVVRAVHEFAAEVGELMRLGADHVWWFRL